MCALTRMKKTWSDFTWKLKYFESFFIGVLLLVTIELPEIKASCMFVSATVYALG